MKEELDGLKVGQASIQTELREVRDLVRRAPGAAPAPTPAPAPAREVVFGVADAPFEGRSDARLTLVEFSDYESWESSSSRRRPSIIGRRQPKRRRSFV